MNTRGYTILEAMIFLAVSAALFVAIAGMFSGRIAQAQFTSAVQELDAQIRSAMTETAAGYYPSPGDLTCTPTATYPNVGTGGSNSLGTNGNCVFIGKAFQFGVSGTGCTALSPTNCDTINVFSLVAKNPTTLSTTPTGYDQVYPAPIAPRGGSPIGYPDATQKIKLTNGLRITSVHNGTPPGNNTALTAFLLPISAGGKLANAASGQELNQRAIPGTVLGTGSVDMATAIANAASQWDLPSYVVGENGVTVCVGDGGGRKAAIIIGGTGHANSTEVLVDGGGCT